MDRLDAEIRVLINAKQRTKAQTKVKEIQDIRKQVEQIETKKNILVDMKIKLETQQMNQEALDVFKGANDIMKEAEANRDKMEDQLADWQDYMQQQEQDEHMWNNLADMTTNKAEIDDEMARYEAEMNQDAANDLTNQMTGLPVANTNQQE